MLESPDLPTWYPHWKGNHGCVYPQYIFLCCYWPRLLIKRGQNIPGLVPGTACARLLLYGLCIGEMIN